MDRDLEAERQDAVRRYFSGESVGAIAASLRRTGKWVRKWVERSLDGKEDWYQATSSSPQRRPTRCSSELEELIVAVRERLEGDGVFHGAVAVAGELEEMGLTDIPCTRTIARIVKRCGLIRRRVGPYVPTGKRYPGPDATQLSAVHQTDFVGPRYGRSPLRFYSLNSVELSTGRCAIEPVLRRDAQSTVNGLWATWCRMGIPHIQQLDNDPAFHGSSAHPRGMGAVIRLCLLHGVEPWFIPPAEPWRNGVIEKFNDTYTKGFLRRIDLADVDSLFLESRRFEERHNVRHRYSKLNGRTPLTALKASRRTLRFPSPESAPIHPLPKPDRGRYHLLRFVRSDGEFDVFGERFKAPLAAQYEYVQVTVDVERQRLIVLVNDVVLEEHPYQLR